MKNNNLKLEEILVSLDSNYSRYQLIKELLKRNINVPIDYVKNSIEFLENEGNLKEAAELADSAGFGWIASDLYVKAGMILDGARSAKKSGLKEKANKLYINAINNLKNEKKYNSMINIAMEAGFDDIIVEGYVLKGEPEKAISHLRKIKKHDEAIEIAKSHNNLELAAELEIERGNYENAISIYTKLKKYDVAIDEAKNRNLNGLAEEIFKMAIEDYENSEKPEFAAYICERFGDNEKAIQFYEKAKNIPKVINLAKKINLPKEKILEIYLRNGMKEEGANFARENDMPLEAIKLYNELGRYEVAGNIAERNGLKNLAKECYLKALDKYEMERSFLSAGEVAMKLEQYERATKNYEKSGRYDLSKKSANLANLKNKVRLYEKIEDLLK